MIENKIPDSWIETTLSDISFVITDGTHKTPKYVEKGVRFISIMNIRPFKPINWDSYEKYITESEHRELIKRAKPERDDILFPRIGTMGFAKRIDWDEEVSIFVGLGLIKPIKQYILPKYLEYYMNSPLIYSLSHERATGTGRMTLALEESKKLPFPLCPLEEQKRIVAKLDAAFTHLDTLKAKLRRIPELLKSFRQAVLTQAVTGKLTEEWRQTSIKIESGSCLIERIKQLIDLRFIEECEKADNEGRRRPKDQRKNKRAKEYDIDLPELPTTWDYSRIEEISYLVTDGTHHTPKYKDSGVTFLSVKNVRPFKTLLHDIKFISREEHEELIKRCKPEKGDILYTKVGATFGYAALNMLDFEFSIFVSLALIKPVKELLDCKYVELTMNSDVIFRQARERVSGIGTPDLHLIEIRDFKFPVPPLEEQKEIVKKVDVLFAKADAIEAQYLSLKEKIDKLPQALLAKAFRGELVPQDEADEPASLLLEKIQQLKKDLAKPKKETPVKVKEKKIAKRPVKEKVF